MKSSGKTRVCAIIGDPVEHSLSPVMHNAAFKELKLNMIYVAFTVTRNELKGAISSARILGFQGLNVTMPHKNAVMKYLDETVSTAKSIGAVNTILNNEGRLVGYNTDGIGAMRALKENSISPEGKKLLLLGAGGAGKAIAFQAAQEVEEIVVLNRTSEKAERLAEALGKKFGKKVKGESFSSEILKDEMRDTNILVNATSVGMHPDVNRSLVPRNLLRSDLCVMDIVYSPLKTRLLLDAEAVGAKVVSGLEMLIYQGAVSFEIWTKQPAPIKVMKEAALNKLEEKGVHR
ncbi:MAG: shikimate dehydrogenase [Candidatus Bathyarchaeum sp.]|nr:MAG: shikimate dehydrogenase [Candidatus Bathyarchaeum sp.]